MSSSEEASASDLESSCDSPSGPASPVSSPITCNANENSSPLKRHVSSSSDDSSPSDDESRRPSRKLYKYNEPEVPDISIYSKTSHPSTIPEATTTCSFQEVAHVLQHTEPIEQRIVPAHFFSNYDSDDSAASTVLLSDISSCSSSSCSTSSDDARSIQSEGINDKSSSEYESDTSVCGESGDENENESVGTTLELFAGSNVSTDEGVLILMNLFMNNRLPKNLVGDILAGILKLLPVRNNMPCSKHLLFKYVLDLCPVQSEKRHYYCKTCKFYLGLGDQQCPSCMTISKNFFYQFSISDQIKFFFEVHNLADVIDQYKAERSNRNSSLNVFSDICDGFEYKRAACQGKYDLVFIGHTDGVSISESSVVTVWPLEFIIGEVPPHLRYKFVLVTGVWVDSSKPHMGSYLKPFVNELQEIFEKGIEWTHPVTKEVNITRVVVPVFCGDAPVRAEIQNVLGHGGRYCCHSCEQKMVRCTTDDNKVKRVFTLKEEPSKLRTHVRMKRQGEISLKRLESGRRKNYACKGVRGRSILSKLPMLDRSTAVYPEYMHIVLGVIKQFCRLWFETNSSDLWSLRNVKNRVNSFLENVKVPDFITRIPRSVDCFGKWKANECRTFLLFLSPVLFSEVMDEIYFQHWLLLVSAMYLLLQDTVTRKDIDKAEILIRMFLRDLSKLYRPQDFTYNMHCLLHLALTVLHWGPLWANAAFKLEDLNGRLTQCIHGSKNQQTELVNTLKVFQGVQILNARVDAAKTLSHSLQKNNSFEYRSKMKTFPFNAEVKQIVYSSNLKTPISFYYRALVKGETYTSNVYLRQEKRNNYTVCYSNTLGCKEFGEIMCFCKGSDDMQMALVNSFTVDHMRNFLHSDTGFVIKHIIPVKMSNSYLLVPLESILFKVIKVDQYVCIRPNTKEVNL